MNIELDGVVYAIPQDVESRGRDAIAAYIATLVASLTPPAPAVAEETDA